jgi:hypothetical protein
MVHANFNSYYANELYAIFIHGCIIHIVLFIILFVVKVLLGLWAALMFAPYLKDPDNFLEILILVIYKRLCSFDHKVWLSSMEEVEDIMYRFYLKETQMMYI